MYYTIKQMAEMFGVTENTLRFYTDKGLLPCARDGGNRRVFNEESVNWMQGIHCLKGCGASIEDIQEYCRLCLAEESEENLFVISSRTAMAAFSISTSPGIPIFSILYASICCISSLVQRYFIPSPPDKISGGNFSAYGKEGEDKKPQSFLFSLLFY